MTQIHLASDYTDVAISSTDAPHLYAASDWGFEIFSLTEPTEPVRIAEIVTPGQARSIAVDGETAYVADGTAGVHVIDISIPTAPKVVKTLGGFTDARKVQTAGDNLYVLGTERGTPRFQSKRCPVMSKQLDLDAFFAPQARQWMLLSVTRPST